MSTPANTARMHRLLGGIPASELTPAELEGFRLLASLPEAPRLTKEQIQGAGQRAWARICQAVEKAKQETALANQLQHRSILTTKLNSTMLDIVKTLAEQFSNVIWCGFYFTTSPLLTRGPYIGKEVCPQLEYWGVCGRAAIQKKPLIVDDVFKTKHIWCDDRARSELAIPIIDRNDHVIAVLDIDSSEYRAFQNVDGIGLSRELSARLCGRE